MAGILRQCQIDSLKCLLNFNSPPNASEVPEWKILIYDHAGRDIISPLLAVKELRALGVTLHLLIDSPREPITDVPAVYFVYPSKENILCICKDFEAGRYESYYLNFISPVSRDLLELVAKTALTEDCVQQIRKVFDQYTNFICLEDDLLVLQPTTKQCFPSYYALNRTKATESDIDAFVDATVDGLFSVFATLGVVPIIRCPRGDASEMIATRLDAKLRDSLRDSRNSLFSNTDHSRPAVQQVNHPNVGDGQSNVSLPNLFQRPLLVLLDRNLDLAAPLHHEMTYQSLVHDVFTIRLNRITVDLNLAEDMPVTDGTSIEHTSHTRQKKPGKMEKYDLNAPSDRLWRDFRCAAFSDVAEAISEEVKTLKDYEKRMGELKSSMGLSGDLSSADESTLMLLDDNTTRLTNAVNSLPQLMERKRYLDMHTNIATCLANVINQRQLHVLAEEEDKLLSKQSTSDCNLSELISNKSVGSADDKLRLLVFAALLRSGASTSGGGTTAGVPVGGGGPSGGVGGVGACMEFILSDSELDQLKSQLESDHPNLDLSALAYVQQLRRLPKLFHLGDDANGLAGLRANSRRSMLNKLVSHGSAIFLTGMRNLIGRKSHLPFTRIVSQLMDNKGASEVDDYRYFDPKLYRRQNTDTPRFKQPFYEAFVFVVGGGSYAEYHDLLAWSRSAGTSNLPTSSSSANLPTKLNAPTGPPTADSTISSSVTNTTGSNSKRIVYGCTDIVSPSEFLEQLTNLGREVSS